MRKITQKLMFAFLLLTAAFGYSQKVAVIGVNHVTNDGFSFVVTQDLTVGEVIYFTENEYDNASNAFFDQSESIVVFTAGSTIAKGNVFYVEETGTTTNAFTVTCTGGSGCGSAVISGAGTFSLATDGESLYAYSDTDANPTNGITTIHSVLYSGTTEPGVSNGGPIPAAWDPSGDFPTAIVVDGFPASPPAMQPGRIEFNISAAARTNVTKLMLENPSNYVHMGAYAALSTQFFTNLNLVSSNPALTVSASPTSISEGSSAGVTYTFTLGAIASAPVTVNFSVSGSAVFGTDYSQTGASSFSSSSGTIVIPSGSNTASFTINIITDTIVEPTETFALTLSSGSGYDVGSPGSATLSITNDDVSSNDPLVAIVGLAHTDPDGFSFVATKDIAPGTVVYFTENSFNNTTLTFASGEAVLSWTSPGTTVTKGNVVVVTETSTNSNTFNVTCSGSSCGTVALVAGDFAIATTGETMYAYADNDTNPNNGVTDVYSVLFTGTSAVTGGAIPAIEDPSVVYENALVVDGFPSSPAPSRTEYNPAGRGVLVTDVIFENISNWLFGQAAGTLSTTPFTNINVTDAVPPTAVCQNISVTPAPGTGSVTIAASQIDNGSSDNVGIASITVSPDTFTCANVGANTVTLTVTDTSGNVATCTATVTVLENTAPTFTQMGPYCSGDTFSLPTTSNNGIVGTWSPAVDNTATTTYTFTPAQSLCGTPVTMTIVVNPTVVPTFTQVAPICAGATLSALPTTSNNGVTGTWAPAIDNTTTTTYTFTPSSGTCVTTATMTITVNPLPTTPDPTYAAVCEGGTLNLNPNVNASDSYTMNANSGVAFIDIDATGTQIGGLADDSEHNISIPAFTFNGVTYTTARIGMNGVLVFGSTTGEITFNNVSLPTPNVLAGNVFIAPFWEDLDIQTGAKIATQTVGNKFIIQYTTSCHDGFTTGSVTFQAQLDLVSGAIHYVYQDVAFGTPIYDAGASATIGIQFSASSALQYSFDTASLVNGQSISFYPPANLTYAWTGPNSFTSTDAEPSISNVTAAAAGTYSLVVTDVATGCQSAAGAVDVTIDPLTTPTFTQVGPVCQGDVFTLPGTSDNSITGTWSPAVDNSVSTTYTFTPDAGQCAATTTMTVVVNPLTSNTTTISACDSYTWAVNGTTYNASGIYNFVAGCHTEILDLTITPSTGNTTTISACDTYTWSANAAVYTASGTYTFVTGCNTETLVLTITPSTSNTTTASACDTYTWAVNGTTYTASGNYTDVNNCHTENLALTIEYTPVINIPTPAVGCGTTTITANVSNNGVVVSNNFSGALAAANWSTATPVGGSVDASAAPNSVTIVSGDNGLQGYTTFSIVVPAGVGGLSFNWSYSTVDGANFDRPAVISNGVPTLMSGYSIGGSTVQSGTMTVNVVPGQTFSLAMFTTDGIFGSGQVVVSNLVAYGIPNMLWTASNGGIITGPTNGASITVSATGTYTLTANNGTCTSFASVNAVVNQIVGDPAVFGNNVWNVYAFNSGGTQDVGNSWNTNYSGYYTISSTDFDTRNQWCDGCTPSDAAGYQGCLVNVDNHSWTAKRRGFPAGVYSIDIPSHDDEAELWINGVMVWEQIGCCTASTAVWQGNLGSLDTVEYRVTEGVGGSHGAIVFNVLPFGPASLTGTYCGATINNAAVTLNSNYVIGAQMYRFRVRNSVTGATLGIVDRPVNSFALSNMPGVTLATTYVIDVMIRVNNVWQPFYGAPCTVTTPTPVSTIGTTCGTTLSTMGQWIYATYHQTVTAYRFRLTNMSTNAQHTYDALNGLNKFNFNQLPASFRSAGTTYFVEVALRNTDGTYMAYGPGCNVTTPGITRTDVVATQFAAIAYPNPFAENFMFDVKTTAVDAIQIRVYDMLGKLIDNRNVEANDINSVEFGDNYPSGVYNVVLSQGENTQTLRVIKR